MSEKEFFGDLCLFANKYYHKKYLIEKFESKNNDHDEASLVQKSIICGGDYGYKNGKKDTLDTLSQIVGASWGPCQCKEHSTCWLCQFGKIIKTLRNK